MNWTDRAVRAALALPGPATDLSFTAVSTDTRSILPGSLFVALQGERFDAHEFLAAAAEAGAAGAVVREETPAIPGLALYRVPDTLRALGDLANARRKLFSGPVIAITGTNGKTSTKEMIAAALRTRYLTHATRINLNNLVGVPLTILEAPDESEALVVEAGANLPGEIGRHREVIAPSITVITNVAAGHLEGFRSGEGVLLEKLLLAEGVPLAVVGTEPPELAEQARRRARKVISAGLANADRTPSKVEMTMDGRARMSVAGQTWVLDALGMHQAANAMLAWAVGEALGLEPGAVARSLERLEMPGGRGELRQIGGMTVLHDAYNANPASFRAAIDLARTLRGNRRLVFVAGTMRELGEASAGLHAEIASLLVALKPDLLAVIGEFVSALEPYRTALDDRLLAAADAASLGPVLSARLSGNELIVLKGSRGVALERLLPDLAARTTSPTT